MSRLLLGLQEEDCGANEQFGESSVVTKVFKGDDIDTDGAFGLPLTAHS